MSVLFSLIKSMDTFDVELPQPRPQHRQVEASQASVVRTVEWVRGGRAQHVVEIHLSHQTCAGKNIIDLLETRVNLPMDCRNSQ